MNITIIADKMKIRSYNFSQKKRIITVHIIASLKKTNRKINILELT